MSGSKEYKDVEKRLYRQLRLVVRCKDDRECQITQAFAQSMGFIWTNTPHGKIIDVMKETIGRNQGLMVFIHDKFERDKPFQIKYNPNIGRKEVLSISSNWSEFKILLMMIKYKRLADLNTHPLAQTYIELK